MSQDRPKHPLHTRLGLLSTGDYIHNTNRIMLRCKTHMCTQILDKTILGFSAIFGLQEDTNLVGGQFSLVGSIAPIAQLAWQPISSILIVKVPPRILMPTLLFGWSVAQTCTAAAHSFGGLMACRFMLGLFEGGCLPLFSVITSTWYRRSEQPLRVAAWYGTNGLATIIAAVLTYGLGKIQSPVVASWQM